MKRILSLILCLIIVGIHPVSTVALAADNTATSLDTGYENVLFSNGYRGFCLDRDKNGAYQNNVFTSAANTSAATSNEDNRDLSQVLKVLFTQCFMDVFVSDENGSYIIEDTNTVQGVVWHYTEGQYVWGEQKNLVDKVAAYSGSAIPDSGYTLTLNSGEVVTFYFMVMIPELDDTQDFFAYKISVMQGEEHKHIYSEDWKSNDTQHWHECECENKQDIADHTGGKADCKNPAVCDICNLPYGEPDDENHTGNTELRGYVAATTDAPGYTGDTHCKDCGALLQKGEGIPQVHRHIYSEDWKSNDTQHWHECECENKQDIANHTGGKADCKNAAVCDICNLPYGEPDDENHTGNTEFRGYVAATADAPGYTGDTYCKDCGELLENGEVTPVLLIPAEPVDLTVKIAWLDENNKKNTRPDSVTVTLYNGKNAVETVTLGDSNSWTYTWNDLDGNGDWNVLEETTPKGYTPSYHTNGDVVTITNSIILIQTGQLNWPIPVLGSLGALMIFFGIFMMRKKKKNGNA